jgi:hypothetical protein
LSKLKRSLGVLAAAVLAVTGVSAGSASAATSPIAKTKAAWQAEISNVQAPGSGCFRAAYPSLQWHAAKCVTARRMPLAPAPSRSPRHAGLTPVGDGNDYSAVVSGLISKGTGTFTNVSSGITEKGQIGGTGGQVANALTLQLNTQFFTGSPACSGSSCQAWQQFVYAFDGCGTSTSCIFIQYWLINFSGTCPSGWFTFSSDCYTNSNAQAVSAVTAKQLASVKLSGTAKTGGNDSVSLSVGSGTATLVNAKDTKIHLAKFWNTTEWGVFGDGSGGAANFGANTALEAQTALTASSGNKAPSCVKEGFTGETNNLKLAKTPALGSEPSPTMGSKQTNGTAGTASCAVAA